MGIFLSFDIYIEHIGPLKATSIGHFTIVAKNGLLQLWYCEDTQARGTGIMTSYSPIVLIL